MPGAVIIPIKSFALGKQRLAGVLDHELRAELGQGLAEHVASTVAAAGETPFIVTADPEVAEWATGAGFPNLADPGHGLNLAASAGVEWTHRAGGYWVVLHSDLPLLEPSEITALVRHLHDGVDVIAPSSDGGTSAVGSTRHVEFSFGVSSFHRHLARLQDPVVVARRGLLLDIDSPDDLDAASRVRQGQWLLRFSGAS